MKILFQTVVIAIRKYDTKDREKLVFFMNQLQDYLIAIDPLHRMRRGKNYGEIYTTRLLEKTTKEQGVILFAEEKNQPIGVIVGVIEHQKKDNLLECIPTKTGRIEDLYVDEKYRSQGIGRLLMARVESYFQKKKCTIIKVEVFAPNKASLFYSQLGFENRVVDMIKVLKE